MNKYMLVKKNVDIVKEISKKITLGKNHESSLNVKGLCPFENDSFNQTFIVCPKKQIYYCFKCHETGDIITWLCAMKNLNQLEVLDYLIEEYNLQHLFNETDSKEDFISFQYIEEIQTVTNLVNKALMQSLLCEHKMKISPPLVEAFSILIDILVDNEFTFNNHDEL